MVTSRSQCLHRNWWDIGWAETRTVGRRRERRWVFVGRHDVSRVVGYGLQLQLEPEPWVGFGDILPDWYPVG